MLGKKKKLQKNTADSQDFDLDEKPTESRTEPVLSQYHATSVFHDVFCNYDYPYDDSYVKWLLESGTNVVSPMIERKSVIQPADLKISDMDTLLKNVSVPQDLVASDIGALATETEEEVTIL